MEMITPATSSSVPTTAIVVPPPSDDTIAKHDKELNFREETPRYVGKYLRCHQFRALCKKNIKLKTRRWRQTLCEIMSPGALISLLLIGLSLSTEKYYESEIYANQSFPFVRLASTALDLRGRGTIDSDTVMDVGDEIFNYNGLFTPPPFDLYVAAHKAIVNNMDPETYEAAVQAQDVINSDIGALLRLGLLALAPSDDADTSTRDAIDDLVDWWNCTSLYFEDTFAGSFASESVAVDYLKSVAESTKGYTWGLVVFRTLVPPGEGRVVDMDFTIRMNVSNVASTRVITNDRILGLDTEYKKYYTSGFLSVQQQIEWYASGMDRPTTCINDIPALASDTQNAFANASTAAAAAAADAEAAAIAHASNQTQDLVYALSAAAFNLTGENVSNVSRTMCNLATSVGAAMRNISVGALDDAVASADESDWDVVNALAVQWTETYLRERLLTNDTGWRGSSSDDNASERFTASELATKIATIVGQMTLVANTVPSAAIETYASHADMWRARRPSVADLLDGASDSLQETVTSVHAASFGRACEDLGRAALSIGAGDFCDDRCFGLSSSACSASIPTCEVVSSACRYVPAVWESLSEDVALGDVETYYEDEYAIERRWGAWNASRALARGTETGTNVTNTLVDVLESMDEDREIAKARCATLNASSFDRQTCESSESLETIKGCEWSADDGGCIFSETRFLAGQFDRVTSSSSTDDGSDTDWISLLAEELALAIDGSDVEARSIDAEGLDAVLRTALRLDPNSTSFLASPFPTPSYSSNLFYTAAGPTLGLLMCMSTLYPVSRLVKAIVEEKETRMKEIMMIMGLHGSALNLSWILTYVVVFFFVALIVTLLLCPYVYQYSSGSLVFFFFLSFGFAEIAFCFFVASVFSRSKLASIAAPISLFASLMPRYMFFGTYEGELVSQKFLAAFLVPTAFTFGADDLSELEGVKQGITWDSLSFSTETFTFANALFMLWVDVAFYGILAWYIGNVVPRQFGVPRPLHFPVLDMIALLRHLTGRGVSNLETIRDAEILSGSSSSSSSSSKKAPSIEIRGLRKIFGSHVAVDGLTLDLYKDQITALLGHNGAGKTTSISMLTGLIPATAGDATVVLANGRRLSVRKDLYEVRRSIGVCPQHDVLYPELTVEEHLDLFAVLKGVIDKRDRQETVDRQIGAVQLGAKRDTSSIALSGGQKRRLSVAIALVGNSQFCFLDEPSSGMDPHARRVTWEMLRKAKRGRTIVLTTHFMDEADMLGDRIAVMGHGRLQCCDTPLALKSSYGVGYTLTFEMNIDDSKDSKGTDNDAVARRHHADVAAGSVLKESSGSARRELHDLVTKHVPSAQLVSTAGAEVSYRLPTETSSEFPSLLKVLERDESTFDIRAWGLSMTTLEEVFLELTKRAHRRLERGRTAANVDKDKAENIGRRIWHTLRSVGRVMKPSDTDSSSVDPSRFVAGDDVPLTIGDIVGTLDDNGDFDEDEDDDSTAASKTVDDSLERKRRRRKSSAIITDKRAQLEKAKVWNVEAGPKSSRRQLVESLRKRWISARRDARGCFCLVVLPIVTVALVLIILNLNLAPTGPSIALYPDDLYPYSSVPVANSRSSSFATTTASLIERSAALTLLRIDSDDETLLDAVDVSVSPLLEEYFSRTESDSRMGAYVFNDTYRYRSDNIGDLLEENPAILEEIPDSFFDTLREIADERGVPRDLVDALEIALEDGNEDEVAAILSEVLDTGALDFEFTFEQLSVSLTENALTIDAPAPVTVLFNATSAHALPSFWNRAFEAKLTENALRSGALLTIEDGEERRTLPRFLSRSHPMPLTDYQDARIRLFLQLFAALFLLIPFSYLPATAAMFVVQERACGSYHLQLVSGVSSLMYWTSTYVWDMMQYFVVIVGCFVVIVLYGATAFMGTADRSLATFLVLLFYGLAAIPLSYCYSYPFVRHAAAQIFICMANFITGFIFITAHFILAALPETQDTAESLQKIFRLFPQYCLGEGMINLARLDLQATLGVGDDDLKPFDWEVTGLPLTYLLLEAVAFYVLNLLIQQNYHERVRSVLIGWLESQNRVNAEISAAPRTTRRVSTGKKNEDDDDQCVVDMRRLATDAKSAREAICLRSLRKVYARSGKEKKRKVAVRALDLVVPRRMVFGLLGENGAGKSTTMKILTGEVERTSGSALIEGLDVSYDRAAVQRIIGYTPQINPLLPRLTGRETLRMYARLKGLPENLVEEVVDGALDTLGLKNHGDNLAGGYSGGMKRKLALGMSLIGGPRVVFLDEPSSGMDPVSRRQIWDIIEAASRERTIVLTSHHMEECEALCSQVAILVEGQLASVGSIQRLKTRFGKGYHLHVRLSDKFLDGSTESMLRGKNSLDRRVEALSRAVSDRFKGAHIVERNDLSVELWIPVLNSLESTRLSSLFEFVESIRNRFEISDYGINQPSLEHVFLEISKRHRASSPLSTNGSNKGASNAPQQEVEGGSFVV